MATVKIDRVRWKMYKKTHDSPFISHVREVFIAETEIQNTIHWVLVPTNH